MDKAPQYRAYINPQPAMSEAEQQQLIAPFNPVETYVQGRGDETREAWIASLRPPVIALVAELFCLAKATGRKDGRYADMLRAEREIADRDIVLKEASSGLHAPDKRTWAKMRDRAYDMLGSAVLKGKVGKQPLGYTETELQAMQAVMESRKYKNWPERRNAIAAKGIKVPGRTWVLTKLPALAAGVKLETTKFPRKKASRVYFIQCGDAVKIGHSVNPQNRMGGFNSPHEMRLLLTIPGGREKERALHKKFNKFRIKGEWFQLAPPILEFIRRKPK